MFLRRHSKQSSKAPSARKRLAARASRIRSSHPCKLGAVSIAFLSACFGDQTGTAQPQHSQSLLPGGTPVGHEVGSHQDIRLVVAFGSIARHQNSGETRADGTSFYWRKQKAQHSPSLEPCYRPGCTALRSPVRSTGTQALPPGEGDPAGWPRSHPAGESLHRALGRGLPIEWMAS